jgi:hypothetical protein
MFLERISSLLTRGKNDRGNGNFSLGRRSLLTRFRQRHIRHRLRVRTRLLASSNDRPGWECAPANLRGFRGWQAKFRNSWDGESGRGSSGKRLPDIWNRLKSTRPVMQLIRLSFVHFDREPPDQFQILFRRAELWSCLAVELTAAFAESTSHNPSLVTQESLFGPT